MWTQSFVPECVQWKETYLLYRQGFCVKIKKHPVFQNQGQHIEKFEVEVAYENRRIQDLDPRRNDIPPAEFGPKSRFSLIYANCSKGS